jgi:hypothetical protein
MIVLSLASVTRRSTVDPEAENSTVDPQWELALKVIVVPVADPVSPSMVPTLPEAASDIDPCPFVIDIPLPAVSVATEGLPADEPIISCPSVFIK